MGLELWDLPIRLGGLWEVTWGLRDQDLGMGWDIWESNTGSQTRRSKGLDWEPEGQGL